jgi:Phage integrase family
LNVEHYDPTSGHLTVTGKGRRQRRTALLPAGGRRAMAAWLEVRGLDEDGPLFCPVDKASRVTIRRLTTQAIYALVDRRARKAGVSHLSPHDGRRTFASDLFDAGVDAVQVQGLMGHASLLPPAATTAGPNSLAWPPSSGCTSRTPPGTNPQDNASGLVLLAGFAWPIHPRPGRRMSRRPWNFGGGPTGDQAASSLVGVTVMVASRAARRAGRCR